MKDCPKASLLKELQANNIYDPKKINNGST